MPEVLTETEPDLPKDWGLVKAACADGQHRFLPDAPKCGCGEMVNPEVERSRLESDVIEAAKAIRTAAMKSYAMPTAEYRATVDRFNSTTDALINFESQQIKK